MERDAQGLENAVMVDTRRALAAEGEAASVRQEQALWDGDGGMEGMKERAEYLQRRLEASEAAR